MEYELPTCLEEAFDFTTDFIYDWEVAKIKKAARLDEIVLDPDRHAWKEMLKDGFVSDDLFHAVISGKPVPPKDLPPPFNFKDRAPGINFRGKSLDGRWVLVKVGWWQLGWYEFGTAYEVN